MTTLQDTLGRQFSYLRLSITELCNFRCGYCLPEGYQCQNKNYLNLNEIKNLLMAFATLGIKKIRLTGGEPTLRKDFLAIAKIAMATPGIEKTTFTTNGYKLREQANNYFSAGFKEMTVSIDSLDPETFQKITGHNRLPDILKGIEHAHQLGIKQKINVVLLKDLNDHEFLDFVAWIKNKPYTVRFIELMRTNTHEAYHQQHHISAQDFEKQLQDAQWQLTPRSITDGPAKTYAHPDYQGKIGFIAPYSKDFCQSCNRLRISSTGDLHLCLFSELGYCLRSLLQKESQQDALKENILTLLSHKLPSHLLAENNSGALATFSTIGG
jgi:cyclic pyranopterin phosphate synthase